MPPPSAAEHLLEFALELFELLADAVFLFVQCFRPHFEAVAVLFEVLSGGLVVGLDEQFAGFLIHRRVRIEVLESVQGRPDFVELGLGLLFLCGDLLGGLLEVLEVFELLLCLRRQVTLHGTSLGFPPQKGTLSTVDRRPDRIGPVS